MHPYEPIGLARVARHRGNRNRRGVGREDDVGQQMSASLLHRSDLAVDPPRWRSRGLRPWRQPRSGATTIREDRVFLVWAMRPLSTSLLRIRYAVKASPGTVNGDIVRVTAI